MIDRNDSEHRQEGDAELHRLIRNAVCATIALWDAETAIEQLLGVELELVAELGTLATVISDPAEEFDVDGMAQAIKAQAALARALGKTL